MVFNRRWDDETNGYIIDRTITGPPPPPSTGTTQTSTGIIVGDAAGISIPPATPIRVTIPGPREAVLDAQNCLTPRWRRFFEELYRRTGALEDNINSTDRDVGGSTTVVAMTITTYAPTVQIAHSKEVPSATLALTGIAPTVA